MSAATHTFARYKINGVSYIRQFPVEWAISHLPNTGPKECSKCKIYGSYNPACLDDNPESHNSDGGVFLGYCVGCAKLYNYERGVGFIDTFIEHDSLNGNSASQTYLYCIREFLLEMEDAYYEKINSIHIPGLDSDSESDSECKYYYGHSRSGSNYNGGYDSY